MKNSAITLVGESEPFVSTHLVGQIDVPYQKIVKLLGKPNSIGDEYKVDAEWTVRINGKYMTIYNYKDGKNYNGASGIPTTKLRDWHIGGAEDLDAEIEILAKELGNIE